MGGHHADDAGLQAQRVARGDQAADARTHTDRHVDFVKVGQRGEQLQAVAGDPGHQPGMERRNQVQAFVQARSAAYSREAWKSSPCSISSAPRLRIAAFFSRLLPCGTT